MSSPSGVLLIGVGVWAVQATVLLGGSWALIRRIRRSAATRHLTWLIAFSGVLVLPALTPFVPTRVALWSIERGAVAPGWQSTPAGAGRAQDSRSGEFESSQPRSMLDTAAAILLSVWALGVLVAMLPSMAALYGIRMLRRRSTEIALPVLDLSALAAQAGVRRYWQIRVSTRSSPAVALTWGLLRPVVLLPKNSESWTRDRLEAVVLHELAHAARGDSSAQWLATIASALLWFNPLVWLCARAMSADAEAAADDVVLTSGYSPRDYATELLRCVVDLGPQGPNRLAGVSTLVSAPGRGIQWRIANILDKSICRGATRSDIRRIAAACALCLPLLACLRPTAELGRIPESWPADVMPREQRRAPRGGAMPSADAPPAIQFAPQTPPLPSADVR